MNNAKIKRKIIEREKPELCSRKLEILKEHLCKDGHDKGQNGRDLQKQKTSRRGG